MAHYRALERAFRVMRALLHAQPPSVRLIDLAEEVKLDKGTLSRILADLEGEDLVQRDPLTGHFQLGIGHVQFGSAVLRRLDIRAEALPVLTRLAQESQETVHLGVAAGSNVIYLEKVESPGALQMRSRVGDSMPIYSTGLGKALLAHLPPAEIDRVLGRGLVPRTDRTITSADEMREELGRIRARGYSTDREENETGIHCVGVPVFNHDGDVIAAISVAGPAFRIDEARSEALASLAVGAARELSVRLGMDRGGEGRHSQVVGNTETVQVCEGRRKVT